MSDKLNISEYIEKYWEIPPLWIVFEGCLLVSIWWRMWSWKVYLNFFQSWWEKEVMSFNNKIDYFKKYSPPPMWLEFVCDKIWNLDPFDSNFIWYGIYFKKLKDLWFEWVDDFEKDFNK